MCLRELKQALINLEGKRWEGDSRGQGLVQLWLIHVDIWQKTKFCKAIILNLLKNKFKNLPSSARDAGPLLGD